MESKQILCLFCGSWLYDELVDTRQHKSIKIISGVNGGSANSSSDCSEYADQNIPDLETLCGYLNINYNKHQCYSLFKQIRPHFNDKDKDNLLVEIPKLCSSCFEKVDSIAMLNEQLKMLQEEIEWQAKLLRDLISGGFSTKNGDDDKRQQDKRRNNKTDNHDGSSGLVAMFRKFVAQADKEEETSTNGEDNSPKRKTIKVLIRKKEPEAGVPAAAPPVKQEITVDPLGEDDECEEDDSSWPMENEVDPESPEGDGDEEIPSSSSQEAFEGPLYCALCPKKVFKNMLTLENHRKIYHTADADKRFQCRYCGKGFVHNVTLRHHIEQIHEKVRYHCDMCPKSFTSKGFLREHKEIHIDGGASLICPHCERQMSSRVALRSHIKAQHEESDPCPCEICGKVFSNIFCLRAHRISVHKIRDSRRSNRKDYPEVEGELEGTMSPGSSGSRKRSRMEGGGGKMKQDRHEDDGEEMEVERPIIIKKVVGGGARRKIGGDGGSRFVCSLCMEGMESEEELTRHLRESHKIGEGEARRMVGLSAFGRKKGTTAVEEIDLD